MNSNGSSSRPKPVQNASGNVLPTPPETPGSARGQGGSQAQPQDQQRRYMSYPGTINTPQPQPAPHQSNGRNRRRTQVELQMYHGITWLGYGAVVPNVSVVTGGPLVDGPLPTHGTRIMGGKGNYEDEFDDDNDLAARVSTSLTMGVNRNARSNGK